MGGARIKGNISSWSTSHDLNVHPLPKISYASSNPLWSVATNGGAGKFWDQRH